MLCFVDDEDNSVSYPHIQLETAKHSHPSQHNKRLDKAYSSKNEKILEPIHKVTIQSALKFHPNILDILELTGHLERFLQ